MPFQPCLDDWTTVVSRPIHIQNEVLGLRVQRPQQPQEVDELLPRDVCARQAEVYVLVIVRTIPAQDVQAFAAAAHTHQKPLAEQQPAAKHQVQAPNRMTGIDIVAARARSTWTFRLTLVARDPPDEGLLFIRVSFPQEATDLVVGNANPLEEIFDSRGRIPDTEGGFDPVADLVGVAKTSGADLPLELFDLVRREVARIALVVQSTEGLEPVVAEDTEPFAQLRQAHTQQLRDFFSGFPPSNSQDGGEALVNPPIQRFLASSLDHQQQFPASAERPGKAGWAAVVFVNS
jgi:hypothetical protein